VGALPLQLLPRPFSFSHFLSRILCFYAWVGLDPDSPVYTSCIARMRGVCHHAQLLLNEMMSCKLFAWTALAPRSSQSLPLMWLGVNHCLFFSDLASDLEAPPKYLGLQWCFTMPGSHTEFLKDLFMLPCIPCSTPSFCLVFPGGHLSHFACPFPER
jgi:hypothetical protein